MNEVTRILDAIGQGDSCASAQLLPLVYDELRRLPDAGMDSDFAIGRIGPTKENMKEVDDLVPASRELFGPTNTIHR